jgi:6-phosphogluconolactonase
LPAATGGANIRAIAARAGRNCRAAAAADKPPDREVTAMINRRAFSALLAGAAGAAPKPAWSQSVSKKTVFYASVGPELALHDVNVADAALQKRSAVSVPANIQYVWPHPSRQYLYVVSSNGGPGLIPGDKHLANAFKIDPASGALTPHGEPQALPSRPIHCCVDGSGEYLLTAFNHPSAVTVHRINRDGTLGGAVEQTGKPDAGIFGHQILVTPGNQSAIFVARGNNAADGKPEDPGALKVFGFKDGVLSNRASVAPGNGYGFGPRHLDFHPRQPWVFVSVERQSQLHVYRLTPDHGLAPDPLFVKSSLAEPGNVRRAQAAGAIHVHPNGRFVYLTNRRRPHRPPAHLRHRPERAPFGGGEQQFRHGRFRGPEGLGRRREQTLRCSRSTRRPASRS